MGRGAAGRQAVEALPCDRYHLPRDLRRLRSRLAPGAAPTVHHQPRCRRGDHRERRRKARDRPGRGVPGRGRPRQRAPVQIRGREDAPLDLRSHRLRGRPMKLAYFDDYRLGVVTGDSVVDVSGLVKDMPHTGPHNLISGVIERFADYRGKFEDAATRGKGVPLGQVKIRPPLPKPVNIECMAVNYMEDGTLKEPEPI